MARIQRRLATVLHTRLGTILLLQLLRDCLSPNFRGIIYLVLEPAKTGCRLRRSVFVRPSINNKRRENRTQTVTIDMATTAVVVDPFFTNSTHFCLRVPSVRSYASTSRHQIQIIHHDHDVRCQYQRRRRP